MNFSTGQLERYSVGIDTVSKYSSNIGFIGMDPHFENNQLANESQNEFPLVDWLMNTAMSRRARAEKNAGTWRILDGEDGKLYYQLPWTVGTTLPEDTTGECCWVPMELQKCGDKAPLNLLCLKYCEDLLRKLISDTTRFGSHDLIAPPLTREGQTINEAIENMNLMSMAWFTARNIILGTSTTGTATLKPFHGLMEVLEDPAVVKTVGANVLGAFESLGCRIANMGSGDFVFAVHPLVYEGISKEIVKGQFGEYPAGWNKTDAGNITFKGIGFIQDKLVPVDVTEGTGEVWLLDGQTVGVIMGTTLRPAEDFRREVFDANNKPESGCATECKYYYNYGTVFGTNADKLMVISGVPISSSCLGDALDGLDYMIKPQTLVPMKKASSGEGN